MLKAREGRQRDSKRPILNQCEQTNVDARGKSSEIKAMQNGLCGVKE